jgi:hypothetical protein
MTEELEEIKKLIIDLSAAVSKTTASHKAALERLAQNQQIDHLNLTEIAAEVNKQRQIFIELDAEVRRRTGTPAVDRPKERPN